MCSRVALRGVWQANSFLVHSRNFLVFLVKAGSAESILTPTPIKPRGNTSELSTHSILTTRWRHYNSVRGTL